jgi:hypothetical protein
MIAAVSAFCGNSMLANNHLPHLADIILAVSDHNYPFLMITLSSLPQHLLTMNYGLQQGTFTFSRHV